VHDSEAVRAISVELATALVEAEILRGQIAELRKAEAKWVHLLRIAVDEYEANNGRIINGRDPHWTVMFRRAFKKRAAAIRKGTP
jgi:site-specific recombinase